MTPSRRWWQVGLVLAGVLLLAILVALILTAPKAIDSRDVSTKALALSKKASQLESATSTGQVVATLSKDAPNDTIALLSANGQILAATGSRDDTAATATVPVSGLGSLRVGMLELSIASAIKRPLSGARAVAVTVCAAGVLLCLVALAVRRRGAVHEERLSPAMATWTPPPAPAGQPASEPRHQSTPTSDRANGDTAERRQLIQEMIRLADTSSDERVICRAITALERVGVTAIDPSTGQRFDPELHVVASLVETNDPDLHDTIAAVIRRGYTDHGRVVREADVEIYGLPPNDPRRRD
jgi:GrpE